MFVLTVMLVVFFIVAVSSWWLDDFGVVEDEQRAHFLHSEEPINCSSPLPVADHKAMTKNAIPTKNVIRSQQQATPALAGCRQ